MCYLRDLVVQRNLESTEFWGIPSINTRRFRASQVVDASLGCHNPQAGATTSPLLTDIIGGSSMTTDFCTLRTLSVQQPTSTSTASVVSYLLQTHHLPCQHTITAQTTSLVVSAIASPTTFSHISYTPPATAKANWTHHLVHFWPANSQVEHVKCII